MTGDRPIWVWFRGAVIGPFPPWEVDLMYSKARDLLLFSETRGWIKKTDWGEADRTTLKGPPKGPVKSEQLRFSLQYHIRRRVLGLFH